MNAAALRAVLEDPDLAPVLAALPQARLVGGAVRDALAGLPVTDIDIATPEPPETTTARLNEAGLRVVPTGLAHGTVTAISNHRPFEITTLRRDVETDGRHAQVAWTDDWRTDAARRDFTINALSLDRDGGLHDFFGGQQDLAAGRVRFVGEAQRRIAEDYLRVLRYFRFFARYGRDAPDEEAVAAIAANLDGLASLSAERVWSEIKRILQAPDPLAALALMQRLGVSAAIVPEGVDLARLKRLLQRRAPADPLLRMAAWLAGDVHAFSRRLKVAAAEEAWLSGWRGPVPQGDDDDLRRLLADEDAEILIGRVWLADLPADEGASLRARLAAMPKPVFLLEGRDALALGAIPGPRIGEALRAVRAWWMTGGCVAGTAECQRQLEKELSRGGCAIPPGPPVVL